MKYQEILVMELVSQKVPRGGFLPMPTRRPFGILDDRELTLRCSVGMPETLRSQVTVATRRLRCFESRHAIAIEEHVLASVEKLLPCWTNAPSVRFVVNEVLQCEEPWLGVHSRFAFAPTPKSSFFLVALLVLRRISKLWFSTSVVSVRNVSISTGRFYRGDDNVAVKAAVRGHLALCKDIFG